MLVVCLFEFLEQHGHLIKVGERFDNCAVLIANSKWRGVVVNGDPLVVIGVFLRDEPPQLSAIGTVWANADATTGSDKTSTYRKQMDL